MSISILQTDIFFREFLTFLLKNKKNIKRKFANEVLTIFKCLSEASKPNFQNSLGFHSDDKGGIFKR